jgi:hypothetical protein
MAVGKERDEKMDFVLFFAKKNMKTEEGNRKDVIYLCRFVFIFYLVVKHNLTCYFLFLVRLV